MMRNDELKDCFESPDGVFHLSDFMKYHWKHLELVYHLFCYIVAVSCKWWMKSGFEAKITPQPQVIGNFLTYPCWDSNSDVVRDSEQSVATF